METDARHAPAVTAASAWTRLTDRYAAVAVAALYVLLMLALFPFRDAFEFNPDEGIEAIKAAMVGRGYPLYSVVWDDQPPLFTYLLLWTFRLFGRNVNSGRILVLLFAAVIVFAMYDLLRLTRGHRAALAAVALLPCTAYFRQLSVSMMAGLPSIALALLCVWALVRWQLSQRTVWLVGAGVLMGLSLVMKLFTAFLLPVLGVWVLFIAWRRNRETRYGARLRPPVVWSLSVLVTAAGILLTVVGPAHLDQLYQGHLKHRQIEMEHHPENARMLTDNLQTDWEVVVLAILGSALVIVSRQPALLIASLWCLVAFIALSAHAPIFHHYHLLLTVPGCLLAGVAVSEVFRGGWRLRWELRAMATLGTRVAAGGAVALLTVAVLTGAKHPPQHPSVWTDGDRFAVEVMRAYRAKTHAVVADRTMFAFRAGYEVPPNLCVISRKRWETGQLTVEDIIRTITAQRPEQVILADGVPRELSRQISDAIHDGYRLVFFHVEESPVAVYVRNDIAGDPLAALQYAAAAMPDYAHGHDLIGVEWARRGDAAEALASFTRAHQLSPGGPAACLHMAETSMAAGDYARGFAILGGCLSTADPKQYRAIARRYAWRRATCPDTAHRNGAEAAAVVNKMLKSAGQPAPVDMEILAAALAAEGQFDAATTVGERLLNAARTMHLPQLVARAQMALELYRQGQPLIEAVPLPTR